MISSIVICDRIIPIKIKTHPAYPLPLIISCRIKAPPTALNTDSVEKTIDANQNLYVIGEAFRVGNTLHIGKPQDSKKSFIITTKSEEDLINSSNQKAKFALIGGIIAIVIGIIMLIK